MILNNQFQIDRFVKIKDFMMFGVLAEKVREFNHMVYYVEQILKILQQEEDSDKINPVGQIHRDLSKIEKNLLNFGLKGEAGKKREGWRAIVEEIRHQRYKLLKMTDPKHLAAQAHSKNKKTDVTTPEYIAKIAEIEMKVMLSKELLLEIEQEIFELCDKGIKLVGEIFYKGLQHRVVSIESRIFYQKLETDLNRYKLEIMQYHK